MKKRERTYTVVENAGYEGERDIREFRYWMAANTFMIEHYGGDEEIERLHVAIRTNYEDGTREY